MLTDTVNESKVTKELVNLRRNFRSICAYPCSCSLTYVVNQVTAKNLPGILLKGNFHSSAEQAMMGRRDSWKKMKRVLRKRCCKKP